MACVSIAQSSHRLERSGNSEARLATKSVSHLLLALFFIVMTPAVAPAGESIAALKKELATAQGQDRNRVLAELVSATVRDDPETALSYAQEALRHLAEIPNRQIEAQIQLELSHVLARNGNNAEALEHALAAEAAYADTGDDQRRAEACYALGQIRMDLGAYREALSDYSRALAFFEIQNRQVDVARALNAMGIAHNQLGDHDTALEHFLEALRIAEETDDKKTIARCHNNIGILYRQTGQFEKALDAYLHALDLKTSLGDEAEIARTLNNIGIVYSELGSHEAALEYYLRALKIKQGLGSRGEIVNTLHNIGVTSGLLGRFDQAYASLTEALEIYRELGQKWSIANALNDLADLDIRSGNAKMALERTDAALEIGQEIDAKVLVSETHEIRSRAFEKLGSYARALESHRVHTDLEKTISSAERDAKIAELQARYHSERQQREIEHLKSQSEKQAIIRNALLIGAVLMALSTVLLLHGNRAKQRAYVKVAEVNSQLEEALLQVKQLSGLLPICAGCKRIRDESGSWIQVESYIREHSEADFSHGICPECVHSLYAEALPSQDGDPEDLPARSSESR
jgi:tetratricopeptide (TPR) repeat protein